MRFIELTKISGNKIYVDFDKVSAMQEEWVDHRQKQRCTEIFVGTSCLVTVTESIHDILVLGGMGKP